MRIFYHNVCRDPSRVHVQHEIVDFSLVLQHFFNVTQTQLDGFKGTFSGASRGICEVFRGITDVFLVPCQARASLMEDRKVACRAQGGRGEAPGRPQGGRQEAAGIESWKSQPPLTSMQSY